MNPCARGLLLILVLLSACAEGQQALGAGAPAPEGCGMSGVYDHVDPEQAAGPTPRTAREAVDEFVARVEREAKEAADFEEPGMAQRASLYRHLAPADGGSEETALVWTASDGAGTTARVDVMRYGPGYVVQQESIQWPGPDCHG